MWVFGYGSLMWDRWENKDGRGCLRPVIATLTGFRRSFNKKSVKNWGTHKQPGPTLNLEANPAANCKGMAFEFPDAEQESILLYLKTREGWPLVPLKVQLELDSPREDMAYIPIYSGENLFRQKTLAERAEMAREASGTSGRCFDYVQGIAEKLSELGLDDPAVTEFWQAVQRKVFIVNNSDTNIPIQLRDGDNSPYHPFECPPKTSKAYNTTHIRIDTQGGKFVEYVLPSGKRYEILWDPMKLLWDVRTLE